MQKYFYFKHIFSGNCFINYFYITNKEEYLLFVTQSISVFTHL